MQMKGYLVNLMVWGSQSINVWLLAGHPDQTVSARAFVYRHRPVWGRVYWIINSLVFWQDDHCYISHLADVERATYIKAIGR